ncbi:MAG: TonB-dependent receptor [Rubrivivax sp.]
MRHGAHAAAAAASALLSLAACAQTAAPQRIEITASEEGDNDRRRREPVAKAVYGRDDLDRHGDTSVAEVLQRLPGISLQGGNPRLRGLGAGYTLILVNGEPAPPGFSLDTLSPAMVERIEVTRGPSAEHSAQAVAGTINIVLRQPARQRQREWRLNAGYSTARAVPSTHGLWSDRVGELSFTLPVGAYQWRGGSATRAERHTRDAEGAPRALAIEGRDDWWGGGANAGPRLQWRRSDGLALDWSSFLQRNAFRSDGVRHSSVLEGTSPPSVDDTYGNRGHWQLVRSSLQLTQRGADGWRLEARVGGQATRSASHTLYQGDDDEGRRSVERLTDNRSRERSLNTSGKLSWPVGDSHAVALGWDLERRRRSDERRVVENGLPQLVGFEGEPFDADIDRDAVYLQDEWQLSPQWAAYLGLRAERLSTRSRGVELEQAARSQVTTPLLHLTYRPPGRERDRVRASLTRSYRAPELTQLIARPSIAADYPVSGANTELAPDRIGNPALRPELATGLDLAYERYLAGGGIVSVGLFHRRIDGLMRQRLGLEPVAWAAVPRWVSRLVNLSSARSTGVELELKGRATELLPLTGAAAGDWSLRGSLALYRSRVDDIRAPDNRLEGQQPWSLTLGADRQRSGDALAWGTSLVYTPAYAVQHTVLQRAWQGADRRFDAYAAFSFSRDAVLRLSVSNAWPLERRSLLQVVDDDGGLQSHAARVRVHTTVNVNLLLRF